MIFFLPWVVLMLVAILAVPIAAKLAPTYPVVAGDDEGEEAEVDYDEAPEAVVDDNFDVEPAMDAEPLGDDAFAEFG